MIGWKYVADIIEATLHNFLKETNCTESPRTQLDQEPEANSPITGHQCHSETQVDRDRLATFPNTDQCASQQWRVADLWREASQFPPGSVAGSASVPGKHLTGNDFTTLTPQILSAEHVLTTPQCLLGTNSFSCVGCIARNMVLIYTVAFNTG